MKIFLVLFLTYVILQEVVGPPAPTKKPPSSTKEEPVVNVDLGDSIEYNRYLKEVVSALESDPEFRVKLEKAEEVDIRTGKIAHELEYVNHHVRSKLDELKRQELERLRHFASKEYELRNDIDTEHMKITPEHLDHSNPNTFEIEDLRKLIAKTTADLAEVDKKRRAEFKEYEMQKEFEKQQQLSGLDEEHKKALEHEFEEKEQKHKKHEPLHHPGSKQQLEEVWEKQDHMENQDFDPKTFFHLHDLDGNGVWDEDEVKTLFLKELDKLYNSGAPEDDMRERAEEMERMREHVFQEADVNKDGLISYQEFLAQTQKPEFEKDEGWDGIDQQQIYSQQEYQDFERQRQAEIQRMVAQGLLPPHPNGMPPPGYQHGAPPQQQFQGQQYGHPNQVPQGQFHPNQVPPQYQGQPNQAHPNQAQFNPNQGHPNQAQFNPNQGHPNQAQFNPNQGHPNQAQFNPNQGHPNQAQFNPNQGHPNQAQFNPNQGHPNQAQFNPNQAHPNQAQFNPNQAQFNPNQGHPNQAQLNPNSGHPNQAQNIPNQAQFNPGQGHPNQVPPQSNQPPPPPPQAGQVPQGQVPSSHLANQQQAIVQQHHQTGAPVPHVADPNAIPVQANAQPKSQEVHQSVEKI